MVCCRCNRKPDEKTAWYGFHGELGQINYCGNCYGKPKIGLWFWYLE